MGTSAINTFENDLLSFESRQIGETQVGQNPIYSYLEDKDLNLMEPQSNFGNSIGVNIFNLNMLLSDQFIITANKEHYLQNREEIDEKYDGQYIAIHDFKIIDFDPDFSSLTMRVYKEHGYKSIFMALVSKKKPGKIKLPTPQK